MHLELNSIHKNKRKINLKYLVTVVVLISLLLWPLPYYIESPGSAIPLDKIVVVDGKTDESPGSFSLTTVRVQQGNALTLFLSKILPNKSIVSKEKLFGKQTSEVYDQMQDYYMKSSQNDAIEAALSLSGVPFSKEYLGVYVMSVEDYSSFYKELKMGDLVTTLDDTKLVSSEEFTKKVQSEELGESISIGFVRDGVNKNTTGDIVALPGLDKNGLGISFVNQTQIETKPKIEFKTERVGGPSGGLMFSLELYQLLSGVDLKQGRMIAGTGTIDGDGNIGRIGGIDKKVVAASSSGATLFFAPDDDISDLKKGAKSNYQEALLSVEKNKLDLEVIPVKNITDAINYLKEHTS